MSTVPSRMQPANESRREAGETAVVPETAIYGRMRQRIVAIGRTRASHKRVARDKYLRGLVHSGAITPNDLDSAIDGCSGALSELAWLTKVDDVVLRRADCVFLVNRGRFPVDDGDFWLNGAYYKICRCLQYDWHYYDHELEQLPQALEEAQRTASRRQPMTHQAACAKPSANASMAVKRGNAWAFVGVLVIGLTAATILGAIIVRYFPEIRPAAGVSIGGAWLVLLAAALALTRPRRRG